MTIQLFLSDPDARFAEQLGWASNGRTGRWAIVLDHGKVVYADVEKEKGVNVGFSQFDIFPTRITADSEQVSGVDAVLAHL